MLNVTLIGTAATMPLPERALASTAIGAGGRLLLIDCGEGTQTAARKAHVSLMKVDVICLTHYHGDHIFGLPGLMQTMGTMNRTEPLTIVGPEGLEEALAPVLALAGDELPYAVRLMELPPEGLRLRDVHPGWPSGVQLQAFPTRHRVISQGYCVTMRRAGKFQAEKARALRIPQNRWRALQQGESVMVEGALICPEQVMGAPRRGLKVVCSGDTMPCDSLLAAAQDADLLICEATYPTDEYLPKAEEFGHTTFAQAGALAEQAHVRQLWLTHYSAMIADPTEYLPAAQAHVEAAVCGVDGMTLQLQFEK